MSYERLQGMPLSCFPKQQHESLQLEKIQTSYWQSTLLILLLKQWPLTIYIESSSAGNNTSFIFCRQSVPASIHFLSWLNKKANIPRSILMHTKNKNPKDPQYFSLSAIRYDITQACILNYIPVVKFCSPKSNSTSNSYWFWLLGHIWLWSLIIRAKNLVVCSLELINEKRLGWVKGALSKLMRLQGCFFKKN